MSFLRNELPGYIPGIPQGTTHSSLLIVSTGFVGRTSPSEQSCSLCPNILAKGLAVEQNVLGGVVYLLSCMAVVVWPKVHR